MATWNCTPNTTSQPIVYTITYTNDNGCTAQTTYTIGSGQECQERGQTNVTVECI